IHVGDTDTAGVHQLDVVRIDGHERGNAVARHAGGRIDDGDTPTCQPVEQRGFAHIRAANNRYYRYSHVPLRYWLPFIVADGEGNANPDGRLLTSPHQVRAAHGAEGSKWITQYTSGCLGRVAYSAPLRARLGKEALGDDNVSLTPFLAFVQPSRSRFPAF